MLSSSLASPLRLRAAGQSRRQRHGTTLRVANLLTGSTSVTVTAGGTTLMSGSPFQTITGYQDIPAGTYTFNVNLSGAATPAYTASSTLANVSAYTFLVFGATSNVTGLLLTDTVLVNVPTGNFAISMANASPTAGGVDLYLTAPGADIGVATPIVTGMVYGASSGS